MSRKATRSRVLPPVLGALSLAVATLACSPAPTSLLAGENVILIVVDTLRADHLGCYGYAPGDCCRVICEHTQQDDAPKAVANQV